MLRFLTCLCLCAVLVLGGLVAPVGANSDSFRNRVRYLRERGLDVYENKVFNDDSRDLYIVFYSRGNDLLVEKVALYYWWCEKEGGEIKGELCLFKDE